MLLVGTLNFFDLACLPVDVKCAAAGFGALHPFFDLNRAAWLPTDNTKSSNFGQCMNILHKLRSDQLIYFVSTNIYSIESDFEDISSLKRGAMRL